MPQPTLPPAGFWLLSIVWLARNGAARYGDIIAHLTTRWLQFSGAEVRVPLHLSPSSASLI
jgi:hypothetical protein